MSETNTKFRFPKLSERTVIMGMTGSGKTTFGVWTLSYAAFDVQPFIVLDYKGDDLISEIPHTREISLKEIPKHPGLYIVRPIPQTDDEAVEEWLRKVWQRERIGLFFDESYMVPQKHGALNAIFTQGRSKKIPVIALTQRPAWLSRFIFSEADHFAVFYLHLPDDQKKAREFLGTRALSRLPPFHSYWYDVKQNALFIFTPVDAEETLERFDERLAPKRRFA